MRRTKQKQVLEDSINTFRNFFSAEELFDKVRRKHKNISLATVYRFLRELRTTKQVHSYVCDRRRIYSTTKRSHCHYECEETNKVFHFDIDSLDFLKDKVPGTITSIQIEVKGICKQCK